jgi:hypothetical protein
MVRPVWSRCEMGTEDDFAAEEYRQQRRTRSWCPVIVVGLVVLTVGGLRLAAVAVDRIFR